MESSNLYNNHAYHQQTQDDMMPIEQFLAYTSTQKDSNFQNDESRITISYAFSEEECIFSNSGYVESSSNFSDTHALSEEYNLTTDS